MLDRRKKGLLDSSGMSEEQRASLVQQLMSLVARLEEEMFQSDVHKSEAEVIHSQLGSAANLVLVWL